MKFLPHAPILLLTGEIGSGKTSLLEETLSFLSSSSISVGGILAKGYWKNNFRSGFDIIDVTSSASAPLARRENEIDRFTFLEEGLQFGQTVLQNVLSHPPEIVLLDEIGPLEVKGGGWSDFLSPLLQLQSTRLLWSIRPVLLPWAISNFQLISPVIVNTTDKNTLETLQQFCENGISKK